MIKIQKKDFNVENEINTIKHKYSSIGAVNVFIGFVRDYNDKRDVKFLELEYMSKWLSKNYRKYNKEQ